MHLFLTDRITCPRCGPEFGLILLAHQVQERRVIQGEFGCANCREQYPVEEGFGDLRIPPRTALDELPPPATGPVTEAELGDPQGAVRMAALLGVTEGPGTLLFTGPMAALAGSVVDLIGGVEAVAVDPSQRGAEGRKGVSRLVSSPGLPFFSATFKGVVVSGVPGKAWLAEAARVLAPKCRMVVLDAAEDTEKELETDGFQTILHEGGILVAQKGTGEVVPLVPLRRP